MKAGKLKALIKKIGPHYSKLNEWEENFIEGLEERADRLESQGKELFMSDNRTNALLRILRKCGLVEGDDDELQNRNYDRHSRGSRSHPKDGLTDDELPF